MTHIKQFRPRWRDRYHDRMRKLLVRAGWSVAILLAGIGLWYSITTARNHNALVSAAEARATMAEADRQEVLDVLAGRLTMVEPAGKYERLAVVTWTTVERVK